MVGLDAVTQSTEGRIVKEYNNGDIVPNADSDVSCMNRHIVLFVTCSKNRASAFCKIALKASYYSIDVSRKIAVTWQEGGFHLSIFL